MPGYPNVNAMRILWFAPKVIEFIMETGLGKGGNARHKTRGEFDMNEGIGGDESAESVTDRDYKKYIDTGHGSFSSSPSMVAEWMNHWIGFVHARRVVNCVSSEWVDVVEFRTS